jgi:hypothetical protein
VAMQPTRERLGVERLVLVMQGSTSTTSSDKPRLSARAAPYLNCEFI